MEVKRISASEARQMVVEGKALLICAYEDEEKCRRNWLENTITFKMFRERLPQLSKDQTFILYCA